MKTLAMILTVFSLTAIAVPASAGVYYGGGCGCYYNDCCYSCCGGGGFFPFFGW